MPRRNDLKKILVLGSGPIVIGQACEFDYSGTQAVKALRREGYEVVLVNSNPATIMTDPDVADRTYVEPITARSVAGIIERERPDALLPNMGGQTALNCAVALAQEGVLERYGVEVIGCDIDSIETGEDRALFAQAMGQIGLATAESGIGTTVEECEAVAARLGYPVVLRPAFTLGGAGGGVAHNAEELRAIAAEGLSLSPEGQVLVEQSLLGWKEIEMEVMRDSAGNGIVVCSIENLDPMGVHTGDSIAVAPCQTLNDYELQRLRDASLAVLDRVGVACGGSNVQFAVNPEDGRVVVIEMNPRVSRSSALASKATGFPIAKFAALLAVGYTLDEVLNDVTGATPACFEPSIDYCVVKAPRFAFEKFKGASDVLTTRMKAVGEVMAIGTTFEEALQKALRSLEQGHQGLDALGAGLSDDELADRVAQPTPERVFYLEEALERGWGVARVAELSSVDPWFLSRMEDIARAKQRIAELGLGGLDRGLLLAAKQLGFSDEQIARLTGQRADTVRALRQVLGVTPVVKHVDTCAGEFEARTNYSYLTYRAGGESERRPAERPRVMILAAGPNRIGQGIEFDYCCCHAARTLHELGFETVMVNCNPETVSTDYDTSDRLYFSPLTFEDVMDVADAERPQGVVVTLGGQTPINLARRLSEAGLTVLGTSVDAIDLTEDRERFAGLLDELGVEYPASAVASTVDEALAAARTVGYPLLVRPSYVLGGRGMAIVYGPDELAAYLDEATAVSRGHAVYLDAFLEDSVELDVDAVCDGEDVYVGAVLEHIEECGIHSGDSACCYPPFSLSGALLERVRDITRTLALAASVVGPMNLQLAVKDERVLVIEMNPRASRTVPFSSKASGVPLASVAARVIAGEKLRDMGLPDERREPGHYAVKESVMPWSRFPGATVVLGPEMRSTGEVMGLGATFPQAFAKTREEISYATPTSGVVPISVCDRDKRAIGPVALLLRAMGYELAATPGTAKALRAAGIEVTELRRVRDGSPNCVDLLRSGEAAFLINTPHGGAARGDGEKIRSEAVARGVDLVSTMSGATALVQALATRGASEPVALQDLA